MGSSKVLDTLQNVILVCSLYNGAMESDAAVANEARDLGHWRKLHDPEQLGYGPDGEKNVVGKTWIKPALRGPLDKPFKNRNYIVTT